MTKNRIYYKTLKNLLDKSIINRKNSVLVVCGGLYDEIVLDELSFKNVLITSLKKDKLKIYPQKRANAEKLPYKKDSYDYTFVHAGLHHCQSPHKALLEMYRVSKKGVLVCEAQDNIFTRLLSKCSLIQDYEFIAINNSKGGVNNSEFPNYVYRWTKREVEKIIKSYDYKSDPHITFFSEFYFPNCFSTMYGKNLSLIAKLFSRFANLSISRYGNLLCFYINKEKAKKHKWIE